MFARNLMTRNVEACALEETAAEAAAIMVRRNCGFVPVVADHASKTLAGVLTDRDMALYLAKINRRTGQVKIKEFYTPDPRFVREDASLGDVEKMMERFQLRRIPVTDEHRRLVGVISLRDLAEEAYKDRNELHPQVTEKEVVGIVESISMAD